jgi:hypothetical protein
VVKVGVDRHAEAIASRCVLERRKVVQKTSSQGLTEARAQALPLACRLECSSLDLVSRHAENGNLQMLIGMAILSKSRVTQTCTARRTPHLGPLSAEEMHVVCDANV